MKCEFADDFFRSVHEAEFDRRDKHDGADSFLLAVVTLLGGVGFYYLEILPTEDLKWWSIAFLVLAGLFAATWIAAVVCLTGSIKPRYIGYLSNPKDLDAFATGLEAYHKYHTPGTAGEAEMEQELRAFARRQYVKCAEKNREENQRKTKWQTRTKEFCIASVFIVLGNAAFAYFVQASHLKTERVELVDVPEGHKVRIVGQPITPSVVTPPAADPAATIPAVEPATPPTVEPAATPSAVTPPTPPAGGSTNGGEPGPTETSRGSSPTTTRGARNRNPSRGQRPILPTTR